MGRECTVCRHERREQVDAALVMGTAYRELASRHGVSISALSRHNRDHVSVALARVSAEREKAGAESALDRLERLYHRALRVLDAAEGEGKASLSLSAIKELRGLVEVLARITGELDESTKVQVVNVQTSQEWQTIRAALFDALAPFPRAAQAVTGRLLALGAGTVDGEVAR